MTVGQRIAQKRKELGLSQEGLGERLGVSRQAIYKWESDAALPEIEKLVNLSREFSVSIDWLLGQEDEAREPRELTAEQLRMVEEIVGRYLAAQAAPEPALKPEPEENPTPQTRMRDEDHALPWFLGILLRIVAFCAALTVSLLLFWRFNELEERVHNLGNSVGSIRNDVNSQVNGIASRVESILQSQNTLTAEQDAQVVDTDYRANRVTVSVRALPRTYVEGMTAEFLLVSNGETVTVPGELGDDHAFTAQVTGPLSDDISVSVVLLTGDQRETQLLNQFSHLYSGSFPELSVVESLWGSSDQIRPDAALRVSQEDGARIDSLRLGLFRDRKLLAWYEHLDEQPGNYHGDWPDTEFFRLEQEWTMEPEHAYCIAAVVVDEYGRERVYPGMAVAYDPVAKFAESVDDYFDPWSAADPANWEY